ncbi:hypothetical protein TrLO_g12416 [Triparma laevis f. longispina]|uniref:Uncharacterized protein n=1 Tax=Triparma laevis f. longispina TaxID=1714387 RepID=A0A9W7EK08_9STRA|nr:hypothetical protein TrLO_g12416 [Triparma laevis f. longispina]
MVSCEQHLCTIVDEYGTITSFCDLDEDDCNCDCSLTSCDISIESCYDTTNSDQPPFPSGGQGCDLAYCSDFDINISDEAVEIIALVGSIIGGLIGLCCICGIGYWFYEMHDANEGQRKKEKLRAWQQTQGQFQAPVSHVPVNFTASNFDSNQGHQFVQHNQTANTSFQIQVPPTGAPPNGQLLVALPSGEQGYCQLPPNAQPGQMFNLPVQLLPQAPQQQMVMQPQMQQAEVMMSAPPMAEAVVYGDGKK